MASARLFIRNDDVWTLDRGFRFFFDLSMEYELPVVHAVIPGKMDKGLIRFLCRVKEKSPHLLDIVQHGWMHKNHSLEAGVKYEFGPSRDDKSQQEDIKQGLKKMRAAFGKLLTKAFVPPYHGYDKRTLEILSDEGFKIFSAGERRAEIKKRFLELPAQVSFTSYDRGEKNIRPAADVLASLVRGIHRRSLSGVLTHHDDFSSVAYRRELKKFFEYVVALKVKEGWRVLLFSDILSGLR